MVRASMADSNQDAAPEPETHVDVERVHVVLSPIEVDILVDALRSVGNVEFAERLETLLRLVRQSPEA